MIRIYPDRCNETELKMLYDILNHSNDQLEEVCSLKCDTCNVKVLCTSLTSTATFLERKLEVTK